MKAARPREEDQHEQRGNAGADGRGDCGEEFAEASVLSGLAGGKAEPRGAAALCSAVLPACGGVSEALAGAGGADGGSAAGIDPGERGGGRESGGAASETVAGFFGGRGRGGGGQKLLPRRARGAGGGDERARAFAGGATVGGAARTTH